MALLPIVSCFLGSVIIFISPLTGTKRGLKHVCMLSQYLYNIYTENIFKQMERKQGLNIRGKSKNNNRYADNTDLLAETQQHLQELVNQTKIKTA